MRIPPSCNNQHDLFQFCKARNSAEQELYLIFLEYRQRAFQGAFHANPDYMHWEE